MNAVIVCLFCISFGFSVPKGLEVIAGSAEIAQISQNNQQIVVSDKSILEWEDFSIHSGETVRFILPGIDCKVLNRVVSSLPSHLLGSLESNGNIYLINPNGILIGNGALINTAGWIASTLDICNRDFLAGESLCFKGDSLAKLVNLGTIKTKCGDIALFGRIIEQQGTLLAQEGKALIGLGREIWLNPQSDEQLYIKLLPFEENRMEEGLTLSGKIDALSVEIQAEGNPYIYAIKQTGSIDANGVREIDGRVFLVAEEGLISVEGAIRAAKGEKGGETRILGEQIFISGEIDTSGSHGGGVVLVGGDYQGQNPAVLNAQMVSIRENARIKADAVRTGNGGKVVVWSDVWTECFGSISVCGGEERGDGGFVEVSGGYLNYQGISDCRSPKGSAGTLLLDPIAIAIQTPDTSLSIIPGSPIVIQPSASPSTLSPATLIAQLGMGNVFVQPSTSGIGGSGDIFVNEDVIYSSSSTLQLSNQNLSSTGGSGIIAISPGISLQNMLGSGNVILDSIDYILVQGNVLTNSGSLQMTAANGIFIGGAPNNMSGPAGTVGSVSGDVILTTTANDIVVRGANVFGNPSYVVTIDGDIHVQSARDLILNGDMDTAYIRSIMSGAITAVAQRDIYLLSGSTANSDAVIITNSNTCSVTADGNMYVTGGSGTPSPAGIVTLSGSSFVNIGQNLIMQAGASGSNASFVSTTGGINVQVGNDLISTGTPSTPNAFLITGGNRSIRIAAQGSIDFITTGATVAGNGGIRISAGRDLSLKDISFISSESDPIELICDALFPSPPGIGQGTFTLDDTSLLFSLYPNNPVPIRVFTARRELNTIAGNMNLAPFVPGTLFINSSTEQWGTYFNSSFGGSPYTIFYKNTPLTIPPVLSFLNKFTRATSEALQNWNQDFYSLVFNPIDFYMNYDMQTILDQEGFISDSGIFKNKKTTLMRRAYRTYNMKKLDPL